jgi:hypothetical protein
MSVMLRPVLGAALLFLVPVVASAQVAAPAAPPVEAAKPAAPADAKSETEPAKEGRSRRLAACRADVTKICPDASQGNRTACLKENAAKLSPECTAALADVEAKAKAMREACATDVKTHCATAAKSKGGEGITQCLRTNEVKLSGPCNDAIKARYGNS